jgi:hypothetical protein
MAEALRVRVLGIIPPTKGELVITITIDTDNSAFEENYRELPELLERIANYYRDFEILPDSAHDSNGNTVCHITQE